jgi:uncharacterized membrane protein (DUF4010 family)
MWPAGLIVAALGGLAIGLERQWSGHATGPAARFGGVRTMSMLGALAGLSGWLWSLEYQALAVVLLAACAALVVTGYAIAARRDVDATTEVSALVVLGAGTIAGLGFLTLSSAMVAITTLVLVEKSRLHEFAGRLDDQAMRAAARFAVMALVVLPLLPTGPYGPLDTIRPRELWMLVLFMSGLSFVGFLARRVVGPRYGVPVTGLLGGLVSSTNVTLAFSRLSRASGRAGAELALGVIGACTVLFPRVLAATIVLNRSVALAVAPYLAGPFAVGAVVFVGALRRKRTGADPSDPPSNPLDLGAALQMAVLFQGVLTAVAWSRQWLGDAGVILSGAVLGLTDVDALTISMARSSASGLPADLAARGIVTGILANTLMKGVIASVIGRARFRWMTVGVLSAMATMLGLTLAWL